MSQWGIKTTDSQGYINLHSDYSSIVYYAEMTKKTSAVQPTYLGDYAISMSAATKTAYYDMGWIVQYQVSGVLTDYLLPFYKPHYSGQQIAVMDIIKKDSTTWLVNLIYQGLETDLPRVFAFAPLSAIPQPTEDSYGMQVFDEAGALIFTASKHPLRVDDVISVKHPAAIKTGDRGSCGDSDSCHIDFSSDQSLTYTGTTVNTSTKLYHIVPSAYGGLAYKNSGSGKKNCGIGGLGTRKYAWLYQSWASFRGTIGHSYGVAQHKTDWLGDFAGACHQYDEGGCGVGGFLGALIGFGLAFFTLGASLIFVLNGALLGFIVSGIESVPALKAYEADQTFDTNNASNLIITDARYYGIDGLLPIADPGGGAGTSPGSTTVSSLEFFYSTAYNNKRYWTVETITNTENYPVIINVYISAQFGGGTFNNVSAGTTSLSANRLTYYRDEFIKTSSSSARGTTSPYYTRSYESYAVAVISN